MNARRLQALAVDIGALRESPAFRRLLTGQLVSLVGRQITVVAVPFQVYALTGSPLAVGAIGLVQAIALITSSLGAGAISDRFDRRRILLITQFGLALCSGLLALGALSGRPPLFAIYIVVAAAAAVAAVDSPTRTAIIPRLVSQERLAGALSLNIALFQTTLVAGPAVGGLVIARFGLPAAYAIDVATFAAAFVAIALLPPQPPTGTLHESPIAAIRRGLQYARHQPVILGGFAMDLSAMIFGLPRAVFPVLAVNTFHAGPAVLGLLYAAPGAGAVIAALTSGWMRQARRLGRIIVLSIIVWGAAIIAFGFTSVLWLALLLLAVAGAADSVSAVCRTTILQVLAPDDMRGRLTAVYFMVVAGGPYLGDVEAGAVANAFGAQVSVVSGGALCVLGLAAAALAFPAVWRYRSGHTRSIAPSPEQAAVEISSRERE
jgi:MFS family permease